MKRLSNKQLQRLEQSLIVNDIMGEVKKKTILLTVIGSEVCEEPTERKTGRICS